MTTHADYRSPITYRIRVQGVLGEHWSDYFGGLNIAVTHQRDPPETVLNGEIVDQSALMGVLNALYDMGFPLLAIESR